MKSSLPIFLAAGLMASACATLPAPVSVAQRPVVAAAKRAAGSMTDDEVDAYLRARARVKQGTKRGAWVVERDHIVYLVVSEPTVMRVMAPIFAWHQLDNQPQVQARLTYRMLQANFDRTNFIRYSVYDGNVYASAIWPRELLTENVLSHLLKEVLALHFNTFRPGPNGYGSKDLAETPETDPRMDRSLEDPSFFEDERFESETVHPRGDVVPEPQTIEPKANPKRRI